MISDAPWEVSGKISGGGADCYVGFDLLVAGAAPNLARARPEKTLAVVSTSQVPTGAMVASADVEFPEAGGLVDAINRVTRKDENVFLDAAGLAEALERAIALNGAAVSMNTQAFRVGRLLVADPEAVKAARPGQGAGEADAPLTPEARALVDFVGAEGELRRLLAVRVPELIAYQDAGYAREYVEFVKRVAAAERGAMPGETRLGEAVARYLFKLMAYKDEYEVARLHLKPDVTRALAADFPEGATIQYHLHPPFLRTLGWKRKIPFGRWFDGVFRLLVGLRRLRGTALDPFGYAGMRRLERALIGEYRGLIEKALATLSRDTYERAVKLAALPDLIRGYEEVKLRTVERFRSEVRALGL